ncbi:uncharacterized protein LOC112517694 [Cynara cardunculus var. scolymus]|uniref:uncharacterized protein LOC112517694 n=1 Tax=Cynara cardunculus var. scolymus TaxID=59895 RepID=UPI000D62DF9B|nr:uncharacterized protein LOC112517694 [Cynara cardunculus var. scolymus]
MSSHWSTIKKIRLMLNMRARTDPWFSDFLLRVGDGDEEAVDESFIRILDDMTIPYTDKGRSKDALIDTIFPSLQINKADSDYIISRAILSSKNENVNEFNDQLIDKFSGDKKIYYNFDEAEDDKNNIYPMEFLNSSTISGLPPHYFHLKIGCPIILLRNIDPSNGLCNSGRLICRGFQQNVIDTEIVVGQHAGKRMAAKNVNFALDEVSIKANNHLALLEIPPSRAFYQPAADFLKQSSLGYALNHEPLMVKEILQQF